MKRGTKKTRWKKAADPKVREVQRLTKYLLRDWRPELLAVRAGVTVYTVYRWAKATTAAHPRHIAILRRLVAAEKVKRMTPSPDKGGGAVV